MPLAAADTPLQMAMPKAKNAQHFFTYYRQLKNGTQAKNWGKRNFKIIQNGDWP
jgi:hypothetical protein